MRRGFLSLVVSVLLTCPVWAGVPSNVPPIDDPLLQKFLKSMADHINTLECLTADPNGSVLGTHGELKCASFSGSHYSCMNTDTGPSKGTSWTCLNIGVQPTTGIFCASTVSTDKDCEEFRGRIPVVCAPTRIDLTVTTVPSTTAIIVDVNECVISGGTETCTTLFTTQSNRPQIAVGARSGSSTTFNDTSVALGNYIGFDIDQGSDGSDLTATLVCR